MMNPNPHMEKPEMDFIKLRINQMCASVSRGRKRYSFAPAANKVFERMFGVKDLADRILDCRSYRDMDDIMSNIDSDAFFNILRQSDSYRMLAGIIMMKYDLDSGKLPSKFNDKFKRAVARMIDEFQIRTNMRYAQYDEVIEFGKGYRDDDDDGGRRRRRRDRDDGYGIRSLFDDDDYSYLEDDYRDQFDGIFMGSSLNDSLGGNDDYAAFREKYDRRASTRSNDVDKADKQDDQMYDMMSDLINKINDLEDRITNRSPVPEPVTIPAQQNMNNPIQLRWAESDSVQKLTDKIDAISDSVDRLANMTANAFDDVYDRIDSVQVSAPVQKGPVKMTGSPTGNFVQSSKENDISEEVIDGNIDGALQK